MLSGKLAEMQVMKVCVTDYMLHDDEDEYMMILQYDNMIIRQYDNGEQGQSYH